MVPQPLLLVHRLEEQGWGLTVGASVEIGRLRPGARSSALEPAAARARPERQRGHAGGERPREHLLHPALPGPPAGEHGRVDGVRGVGSVAETR